jgi:hypothetical protein
VYDGLFPHVGSASSTGTDVEGAAISSPERHGHT